MQVSHPQERRRVYGAVRVSSQVQFCFCLFLIWCHHNRAYIPSCPCPCFLKRKEQGERRQGGKNKKDTTKYCSPPLSASLVTQLHKQSKEPHRNQTQTRACPDHSCPRCRYPCHRQEHYTLLSSQCTSDRIRLLRFPLLDTDGLDCPLVS